MEPNTEGTNIFREVDQKADIVNVVSAELGASSLIRKGKIYVALCPFHHDSNPSMQVNPERNTYHCFACGAMGGSIRFVQEYEKIKPLEALKKVCSICSIPLPQSVNNRPKESAFEAQHSKELDCLMQLEKFYTLALQSVEGNACREYLEKRKIPAEIISEFGLGYAPEDTTQSIRALTRLGFDSNVIAKAGILPYPGASFDRYQNRLMFPIRDSYGRIVAFSGRVLSGSGDGQKYINYAESDLFRKGKILYHYHEAKAAAKKAGYLYLCEGFFDVIAYHRAGISACAGTMGTALTKDHARMLKDLGVEVRLALDADEAGQQGMEKAAQVLLEEGVKFRILRPFTKGKDADEVLTECGKEVFLKQVTRLYDPVLFFLRRACGNQNTLTDSLKIQEYLKRIAPYFAKLDLISQQRDLVTICQTCTISQELALNVMKNTAEVKPKPVEVVPEPKEENPRSTYVPYRPKPRMRRNSVSPVIGEKYQSAKRLRDFEENYTKGETPEEALLLQNELEILYTLPMSKDSYYLFQKQRIVFQRQEFDILSNLIGQVYYTLLGEKERYDDSCFASLETMIETYGKEEDVFDPFADEEETVEPLSPVSKEFLTSFVALVKADRETEYSQASFERLVKLHPLYLEYRDAMKAKREGRSFDLNRYAKLIKEIKACGGTTIRS